MAPSQISSMRHAANSSILCWLPVETDDGLVYIDIQDARPAGTLVAPSVLDLEVYEPGDAAGIAWIYFKGDYWNGPSPGHPVDAPFKADTLFSVALVRDNDTTTTIRELSLAPTNDTLFWKGFGPAHESNGHLISLQRFPSDCRYRYAAAMLYVWEVPKDLDDAVFRLKLSTDVPPTTQYSGRLQISGNISTFPLKEDVSIANSIWGACEPALLCVIVLTLALGLWITLRGRGKSGRLVLES
ncbi:hypothetical protein B0A48_05023 [Cryoendolithus antarcticus]|uniref:Uncharacterized protein n=1 Tax=Cryoendolithus antarcticus TaxID=1507870 RepID=A0A1V8TED0_9PEZI|nr:hypothetical protein B0A48_05023 [Cryoendolithus antarcticus]